MLRNIGSLNRLARLALVLLASVVASRAERVAYFTGAGAVTLPNLSVFKFGASNDFALEFWIKPANAGTESGAIFANDSYAALTGNGTNGGWGIFWQSGGIRVARKPSISGVNTNPLGGSPGQLVSVTTGA